MKEIILNNQDRLKTFTDAKALLETMQGKAKHPLFQRDFFNNIICVGDNIVWRLDVDQNRIFTVTRLTPKKVYGTRYDCKYKVQVEWSFKAQDTILVTEM